MSAQLWIQYRVLYDGRDELNDFMARYGRNYKQVCLHHAILAALSKQVVETFAIDPVEIPDTICDMCDGGNG